MSTAEDMVKAFILALEAGDFETASTELADDFVFSGWTPQPLDKSQFLSLMGGLKAGIPNLAYHFRAAHNVHERVEDTRVKAVVQLSGTQTEGFILPSLGLPPIPQLARAVSLPEEYWNFSVEQGLFVRITVEHVAEGGIQGLLQQLGVDIPVIQ